MHGQLTRLEVPDCAVASSALGAPSSARRPCLEQQAWSALAPKKELTQLLPPPSLPVVQHMHHSDSTNTRWARQCRQCLWPGRRAAASQALAAMWWLQVRLRSDAPLAHPHLALTLIPLRSHLRRWRAHGV